MPWKVERIMDQRIAFVLAAKEGGKPLSRLCRDFGISRPTGYLWLQRYEAAGTVTALAEESRRPHNSPTRTPPELEKVVVRLRRKYNWGARKLKVILQREGLSLPVATIHRILLRHKLVSPERRFPTAVKRFVREESNQLVQMDFKGEYPLCKGYCYPLSLLDDHSRYLLGLWPLSRPSAPEVKAVLEPFFYRHGVPEALLLDHGIPWWSTTNAYGLTWLSVWLIKQDIKLHFSRIRHPQTQGKVERMHRSLHERTRHEGLPLSLPEWRRWSKTFQHEYNEIRPHEALQMQTPAQVYQPVNLHPYQPHPPEWDYSDATVARVDALGMICWHGRRYFVCEALKGERVRLDLLDDRLLVTFRTTTLREIDLNSGRSHAVVLSNKSHQKCKGCPDNKL